MSRRIVRNLSLVAVIFCLAIGSSLVGSANAATNVFLGLESGLQALNYDNGSYTVGGKEGRTGITAVEVNHNGHIITGDTALNRITSWSYAPGQSGTGFKDEAFYGSGAVNDLAIAPNGDILAMMSGPDWVARYTYGGQHGLTDSNTMGWDQPSNLTVGLDGNVIMGNVQHQWLSHAGNELQELDWHAHNFGWDRDANGKHGKITTAADGSFWLAAKKQNWVVRGTHQTDTGGTHQMESYTSLGGVDDLKGRSDGYVFTVGTEHNWVAAWKNDEATNQIGIVKTAGHDYGETMMAIDEEGTIHLASPDGVVAAYEFDVAANSFGRVGMITLNLAGGDQINAMGAYHNVGIPEPSTLVLLGLGLVLGVIRRRR